MFDFPVIVNILDPENSPEIDPNKMDTMMTGAVCCEISPDDKYAAMSSTDGAVRVVTMDGHYTYRFQQKSSAVAMVFSPDSQVVLSSGYRSIYVWSMLDGSCKYVNNNLYHFLFLCKDYAINNCMFIIVFSNIQVA
jgi:WD40 repeat protein